MKATDEFDYIIVGAGSAGCVLADRLSHNGRYTVAVVEAGGPDSSLIVKIPAGAMKASGNPDFDWCYMSEPDPTRDQRTDAWPRGKVVGGSSSTNGQLWVRGQAEDYDAWAAQGNAGWSYNDVLPYFRELESYTGVSDDGLRGADGPLHVEELRKPHILSSAFVAAASETGIPAIADYNGANQEGASIVQVTQKRGWRQSASKAFLRRALKRKNVHLIVNALVRKIDIEDKIARGITYSSNGATKSLRARQEVILSAGAIGSPQLLMLSGLGPGDHLRERGIDVVENLPGVGQNLQEHSGIWVVQEVVDTVRTVNQDYNLMGIVRNGLRFLIDGTGAAASPPAQATAFIRSGPQEATPDVQVLFTPLGYSIEGQEVVPMASPAMMCVPTVCHPDSRGEIRLKSASATDAPLIFPRLLSDDRDSARLQAACEWVRKLFEAPSMKPYAKAEQFPGPQVDSDADWRALFRAAAGPVFHVTSTCAMGSGPDSVVDADLRVRGVGRLRVADASIMPRITSGNTNAPAMMIGAKAADLILRNG
ncbi:GMC family oxidoreductase N-terminal domain-containing protein [uncultured Parasphingorhabdus sp.]|uniref:GMC family oxidoreductase n=1 Tax=uncultured Parasphingorhabdus sp. TaxID=2709694 RepID=UPI002AA8BA01|nr:GMC family oxidoreductase N-terminal domain-containing protein [uncultured Parasphingorhabdus sp.]